jgi:O-Antigen ligase
LSAALPYVSPNVNAAGHRQLSINSLRNASVWLLFASGFLAFVEPAPFEIAFGFMAVVFMLTGMTISMMFLPLITLLLLYNIGGGLSLMEVADESRAIWFVAISVYMAVMGIMIACIFSEDTLRRLELMKSGYAIAAMLASIAGIIGYFDVGGLGETLTRYGRASGTFKDPNVFSTFLALPVVYLIQGFFLGTHKRPVIALIQLTIIMGGLFLSFSRGAWGVTIAGIALCLLLSFMTEPSGKKRLRIIFMALLAIGLFIIALSIALQFEAIRATFEVRASLSQDYDQGEMGRFGKMVRAVPMLLELPNGFGPTMFREYFPEDPHNTFLNAFASYGWLGGVSYFALILATMAVGWSMVFKRTPWQRDAIAIWSAFFFLMLQGFQIDTDHWRHFYVQLGLTWGLMLATLRYQARQKAVGTP